MMQGNMVPGTARMGTSQGNRLGTGTRTRQGTVAQPPLGVGALTEVTVTDRPMTMQGVMGMKTGQIGPKRQIYDKSFFTVELRKRCQELQEEVGKLNKEINDIQQDNQLYQNLEKRYDQLVKTVRTLEGDLADHNLATDKQRTGTQPEEVHHMFVIMKQQNEQQRSDIDQIFLEKRGHEEEIKRMDMEILNITRAGEEKLRELDPDQRREFDLLREENVYLGQDLVEGRDELDQVSGRLNAAEGCLRSDLLRARRQQLIATRKELLEKLEVLQKDVQQCSMSIPEQREILLSRVKSDNAEIVATEKQNSSIKLENEKLKSQIREVIADTQERKEEGSGDQQKYEILFAKDQEMTQFIDSFDSSKAEEKKRMKEKQATIVRLLENISKSLNMPTDLTPEEHLLEMKDELDFKSKQLHNSETTQNRLEGELTKREGELEKIESLDTKISQELRQVEEKMKQYEHDIKTKYDLTAEMQGHGEAKLKKLEERKKCLLERSSTLRQQVGFLKLKHQSKRQQLIDNEVSQGLEVQEQKIQQFGQTIHTLRTFIQQKSSESDFSAQKNSCISVASHLNKMVQEQLSRPAVCA